MLIAGYIRFSYLGRNDTKTGRSDLDDSDRFAQLYAADRMAERFYFFEKITLPSLRGQTDPDFKIVVLCSDGMPQIYKDRLEALVQNAPQIEVVFRNEDHISDAVDREIDRLTQGTHGKTVHFRLDDDDAVSQHTIATLKNVATFAPPDTLVTFPRGLYLTVDGDRARLLRKYEEHIAIAWAIVGGPGQPRNPYRASHRSHHEKALSISDGRPYSYIHVAHTSSDTFANQGRKLRKALAFDPDHGTDKGQRKIDRILRKNFPMFDHAMLEQIILNAPGHSK